MFGVYVAPMSVMARNNNSTERDQRFESHLLQRRVGRTFAVVQLSLLCHK
jgi:hypothetical protein